jgi:hypothetical protein
MIRYGDALKNPKKWSSRSRGLWLSLVLLSIVNVSHSCEMRTVLVAFGVCGACPSLLQIQLSCISNASSFFFFELVSFSKGPSSLDPLVAVGDLMIAPDGTDPPFQVLR